MADKRAPPSPPEPEVYEILLPITVFELSDDEFLKSEDDGLTALEENSFRLPSGKAEIVSEGRGAEGAGEEHLNEGALRVKHREKQATPVKVTKSKECDEEVPHTCEDLHVASFQNVLDHSEPGQNRVTSFFDPTMHYRTEKEDVKIRDFGGDHSHGQRMLASLNTLNEGKNNVTNRVINVATTVSQETDPPAKKVVRESLPELPAVDLDRSVNCEGAGPLETGHNETGKRPRKSSALNEETHQGNNSEQSPNVADETEQGPSSFVNGNCFLGGFPEDAESLARDGRTNPEPDSVGGFVPPELTDCPERHDARQNMHDSNESAESDQQLLKEASLLCNKPNTSTSLTPTKKHAKTTGGWKCSLCSFEGTSFVRLKKHFYIMHKNKKNRKIIQRSFLVCSGHCRKFIKKRKVLKKGRTGSGDPGEDRRGKGKPAKQRKKTKSKYEKFFSIMKKVPEPSKSFCCKICSFIFSDPKDFAQHTKEHANRPPYQCPQCAYTSDNHSYFLNHLYWHAGSELYQCRFCEFLSRHFSSMVKHTYLHTEGKTPSPDILEWKKTGRFQGTYICDQCGLVFHKEDHLVYHKAVHSQVQPSENVTCNDQQSGGDTELPEAQSTGGPSVKLFKCLQCAYITSSFSNLCIHFVTHTGEKPFKCLDCSKAFRNSSNLKRHRLLHVRNRHRCSRCLFICGSAEDLKLHEETCKDKSPASKRPRPSTLKCESSREQTNGEETKSSTPSWGSQTRSYMCEHCDYSTYTLDNLKIHTRIHTGEKPYACDVCQKKFRTSSNLKRHTLVHEKREFNCSSCDYSTSTWQSFKQHAASHRKADFQCEKCSYSTVRKENLKIHFRIHTGEKPYRCPHCSRSFRTPGHLKKHLPTHVKLQCDKCDFSTLDEHALQKHAKTHKEHSNNVYKCNKCRLTFSMFHIFKAHKKKHNLKK